METGKVEYAPDYKSKSKVRRIAAQKGVCSMCGEDHAEVSQRQNAQREIAAERARLEREVVEAAKKWVGFCNGSSLFFSDTALAKVINELLEFEENQK